jgi:hypothetical protein
LVSIVSFSKPRYNKSYDWEIIRSCNKINTSVAGGFSKILNYFKNNYKGSIITYADARYFDGKVYLNSGFKFERLTSPNYYYFKKNEQRLYHRSVFQKHKLEKLLEKFDPAVSEYQNMLNNAYLRIFDAGNLVFTFIN